MPDPLHVLVVEDDPEMGFLVRLQVETGLPGLSPVVEVVTTVTSATARLLDGPLPDVVVLDLGLPDAPVDPDRLGALRVLLSIDRMPPVIVITANITDPGERALEIGAAKYLHKVQAVSGPHLVNAISHVLAPA